MNVHLYPNYGETYGSPDPEFVSHLAKRRARMVERVAAATATALPEQAEGLAWLARSYPVLAVLAPVMSASERTIEYPGDPMALYSALSVAVEQAVQSRQHNLDGDDPYNDLCPGWGWFPSADYRSRAAEGEARDYKTRLPNTDQTVFDPRVWNADAKEYFIDHVLRVIRPSVVLISAVSPANRYALDIARTVRQYVPEALIVLGGRHADETVRYEPAGRLDLAPSSALMAIAEGRSEPAVDFVVSGEGYAALDLLLKAISVAMDLDTRIVTISGVVEALKQLAPLIGPVPGQAVIVAADWPDLHAFPLQGRSLDLGDLPSPYQAFAIRARFPIFENRPGGAWLTAHMMTANSCPFHCYYCSETMALAKMVRFTRSPVEKALARVIEYVGYGAEALFFDDSIFWAGHARHAIEFCRALARAQAEAASGRLGLAPWLDEAGCSRLANLQWGAQLTADILSTINAPETAREMLGAMRQAGCTYIYFGIESLADPVIARVHKNRARPGGPTWQQRVRAALEMVRESGIRAGASVLFGLSGETRATADETVEGIVALLADGLLCIASPNILTYHPATPITVEHDMQDRLDYDSPEIDVRPPYTFFEEAFPCVVSRELSEDDVWYIHQRTRVRWSLEIPVAPPAALFTPPVSLNGR